MTGAMLPVNKDRIYIPEKVIKMLHGRFVHVAKTNRFANLGP